MTHEPVRWRGLGAVALCVAGVIGLVAASPAGARWTPPPRPTWYWQLQGAPRLEPVQVSDIDGLNNSAATVARFHSHGQHVICYIDVGTWESFRRDAGRFPSSLLGRGNGWSGERWLDIRRLAALKPIIGARLRTCARKGFDAVEPDNIDGFQNRTGFAITAGQQLAYDEWVARAVHALGMAVFEKNDPEQARLLEPYFDGVLDEQCQQYSECGAFRGYVAAGKPVLDAEYRRSLYPGFCTLDRRLGIMGALFNLALDGSRFAPC